MPWNLSSWLSSIRSSGLASGLTDDFSYSAQTLLTPFEVPNGVIDWRAQDDESGHRIETLALPGGYAPLTGAPRPAMHAAESGTD